MIEKQERIILKDEKPKVSNNSFKLIDGFNVFLYNVSCDLHEV